MQDQPPNIPTPPQDLQNKGKSKRKRVLTTIGTIVGIVFVLETVSVMIQVLYFKKTGKRFFKMAPIHHHFEMCGWKERKICVVFTLVQLFGGIIGTALLYYGMK